MRFSTYLAAPLLLLSGLVIGCAKPTDKVEQATPEPVEAVAVSFGNTKCPIMGGKPTAELTAQYDGQTIGFCCDGCPQKWATLSEEERAEKFASVKVGAAGDGAHDHDAADEHATTPATDTGQQDE